MSSATAVGLPERPPSAGDLRAAIARALLRKADVARAALISREHLSLVLCERRPLSTELAGRLARAIENLQTTKEGRS